MNRFITLLLLGVIGIAMLLIFLMHTSGTDTPPAPPSAVSTPNEADPVIETMPEADPSLPELPAQKPEVQKPDTQQAQSPVAAPAQTGATPNHPAAQPAPKPETSAAQAEPKPEIPAEKPASQPETATEKPVQTQVQSPAEKPQTPATASTSLGSGKIIACGLHFEGSGMLLRIEGDSPMPVKYFILTSPERLVVDLPGSWKNLKAPAVPSNNIVKAIRIGRQGNADRLVLDLAGPLKKHELKRINDNKVELHFEQ